MTQLHETWGMPETLSPAQLQVKTFSSQGITHSGNPEAYAGVKWRKGFTRYLICADVFIVFTTLLAFGILQESKTGSHEIWILCAAGLLWIIVMELRRTRAPRILGSGAKEYRSVVESSAVAGGIIAFAAMSMNAIEYRDLILIAMPVGILALLVSRWAARRWLYHQAVLGKALSHVVVVGSVADVKYVMRQINSNAGPAYRIVGMVTTDYSWNESIPSGMSCRFGVETIEEAIASAGADAVIVAGQLKDGPEALKELCWLLEESRTQIIMVSSLTNVAGPRISIRPVDGLPLMHVDLPNFSGGHHVIKRLLDIVLSASALIVLLPVFAALAVLIKKDSPGPTFFVQKRVGVNGNTFRMFKFRSMHSNAEELLDQLQSQSEGNGLLFKMKDDPRVTQVGRWIRKYSLDELPQIFNVLRGEMSLVGPRPPLPKEVQAYEGHVGRRLYIKPGLTGLWQVSGRSDLDWEESVRLDLYYVENWSLTGDIMIMWRTFKVMLNPVGAY
ncbi:sugar transferase [Glutamicibacter ardleyensis]|uniref:sugar transferase n=1 Tax=Glutamicibacter ardleyensis TaxID=225894 RepID=UPI003F98661F